MNTYEITFNDSGDEMTMVWYADTAEQAIQQIKEQTQFATEMITKVVKVN